MPATEKSCFVIAPLGVPGSTTHRRYLALIENVVRPALEPLGYTVSGPPVPGALQIIQEVTERVLGCDLVVADLTGGNPNVFYELCLRHVQGTPLVQLAQDVDKVPFDVRPTTVLEADPENPESVRLVVPTIQEHVRAMEAHGGLLSPRKFELSALPDLLSRIPSIIWSARDRGPSRADWTSLVKAVEDIRRDRDPGSRSARLTALGRTLTTLQRTYAPRRPGRPPDQARGQNPRGVPPGFPGRRPGRSRGDERSEPRVIVPQGPGSDRRAPAGPRGAARPRRPGGGVGPVDLPGALEPPDDRGVRRRRPAGDRRRAEPVPRAGGRGIRRRRLLASARCASHLDPPVPQGRRGRREGGAGGELTPREQGPAIVGQAAAGGRRGSASRPLRSDARGGSRPLPGRLQEEKKLRGTLETLGRGVGREVTNLRCELEAQGKRLHRQGLFDGGLAGVLGVLLIVGIAVAVTLWPGHSPDEVAEAQSLEQTVPTPIGVAGAGRPKERSQPSPPDGAIRSPGDPPRDGAAEVPARPPFPLPPEDTPVESPGEAPASLSGTLAIEVGSERPQGGLMLYLGGERIWECELAPLEGAPPATVAERRLDAGPIELTVYRWLNGHAPDVQTLRGDLPVGASLTLQLRIDRDGHLDAALTP